MSVRPSHHTHTHTPPFWRSINGQPLSRSSPVSSQFQFSRYGGFDRRQLLKLGNSGCPNAAQFCTCVLAEPRRWRVGRPRDRGSIPVTGEDNFLLVYLRHSQDRRLYTEEWCGNGELEMIWNERSWLTWDTFSGRAKLQPAIYWLQVAALPTEPTVGPIVPC